MAVARNWVKLQPRHVDPWTGRRVLRWFAVRVGIRWTRERLSGETDTKRRSVAVRTGVVAKFPAGHALARDEMRVDGDVVHTALALIRAPVGMSA